MVYGENKDARKEGKDKYVGKQQEEMCYTNENNEIFNWMCRKSQQGYERIMRITRTNKK